MRLSWKRFFRARLEKYYWVVRRYSEDGEEVVRNGGGVEVGDLGRDDGLAAFEVGVGVWVCGWLKAVDCTEAGDGAVWPSLR